MTCAALRTYLRHQWGVPLWTPPQQTRRYDLRTRCHVRKCLYASVIVRTSLVSKMPLVIATAAKRRISPIAPKRHQAALRIDAPATCGIRPVCNREICGKPE